MSQFGKFRRWSWGLWFCFWDFSSISTLHGAIAVGCCVLNRRWAKVFWGRRHCVGCRFCNTLSKSSTIWLYIVSLYARLWVKWPLLSSEGLTESLYYWRLEVWQSLKGAKFLLQLLTFDATLRFSTDEKIMYLLLEKWLHSLGLGCTANYNWWSTHLEWFENTDLVSVPIWRFGWFSELDSSDLNPDHWICNTRLETSRGKAPDISGHASFPSGQPHFSEMSSGILAHPVLFQVQVVVSLKVVGVGGWYMETGPELCRVHVRDPLQGWGERAEGFVCP